MTWHCKITGLLKDSTIQSDSSDFVVDIVIS